MEISEKSVKALAIKTVRSPQRARCFTLGVQKVADWHWVSTLVHMNGSIFEHLLAMSFGSDAHVLLAKRLDVRGDVGMLLLSSSVIRTQLCSKLL